MKLKIYPNPVKDKIYFEGIAEPFDIKIFNSEGKILLTQINIDDNQININELQNGFYFMEIKTNERKEFRKFLKAD